MKKLKAKYRSDPSKHAEDWLNGRFVDYCDHRRLHTSDHGELMKKTYVKNLKCNCGGKLYRDDFYNEVICESCDEWLSMTPLDEFVESQPEVIH